MSWKFDGIQYLDAAPKIGRFEILSGYGDGEVCSEGDFANCVGAFSGYGGAGEKEVWSFARRCFVLFGRQFIGEDGYCFEPAESEELG